MLTARALLGLHTGMLVPCDLIWVLSAHFLHGLLQVIYSRNGVNVTSTPVQHYTTAGPVALRLDYAGLSVTYSGALLPQCLIIGGRLPCR